MTVPNHDHKTFYIKQGDRLPSLEVLLIDCEGNPLDLTAYSGVAPADPGPNIFLVIAPCVAGRRIVDMAVMTVKGDPLQGRVVHQWSRGQTDKPGEYQVEVILSPDFNVSPSTDQKLMTLPGGGYGKLIITPRL